ncbi:2851_t:CDS:2 [Ambispora gerdemannii]|uniref:2851_t:CDS:1 n=1 Tax=Ambispora gerdemannii TaxID=144530 RepID=A0A9N8ZVH0_9GLOM|nr:2851_t:CDS:2 [Ambispora gerdemannii]
MSLFDNTDSLTASRTNSQNSSPRDQNLEYVLNCESNNIDNNAFSSISNNSNANPVEDDDSTSTRQQKRRGRKPKYPDPTPGYRSSYSVNRSFTQAEVVLLKHILKESGQQLQHNPDMDMKIVEQVTDTTMVFPVHEENPKNQELLSNARRKRSRNVTSPYQSRVLRKVLAVTSFPSTEMREALANALNMHPRTVQIWFQNQRQKAKNNPQTPTTITNMTTTASSQMNHGGGGMTQLSGYSPELVPMTIPAVGTSAIYYNLTMFPNNNVVQGAINSQAILTPPISEDSQHHSHPHLQQHGQLQLSTQSYLPVATTYMSAAQFATAVGSPYTILPMFQSSTPSPPTPTHLQASFHHPQFFHQTSSSPTTPTTTHQFPSYLPTTTATTTTTTYHHPPLSQADYELGN